MSRFNVMAEYVFCAHEKFVCRWLAVASIVVALQLFPVVPAVSETLPGPRLVIADGRGNWGAPSPYLHDRRGPGYVLTSFVFDTLLWKDESGALVPSLAESWREEGEGTQFTFTVDADARWHDGRPVTAEDVVFTFDYLRSNPYYSVDVSVIRAVVAIGEREVRFDLDRPFVPFLANVAGSMPILPRHVFSDVDNPRRFSDPEAFTGSGPFTLKVYDPVQGRYLFEANADYHLGAPAVGELAFIKMAPAAALAALEKGEVDVISSVRGERTETLNAAGLKTLTYQMSHPVRLKFNHAKDVLADPRVRHGVAHLVNRRRLIETVYLGQADLWDPRGLSILTSSDDDLYPYDPAAATGLLTEGGWRQDDGGQWDDASGQDVALKLVAMKRFDALARMIAAQLQDGGIKTSVLLFDRGGVDAALKRGDYDLALTTYSVLGDPDIFRHGIIGNRTDSDHYTADPELTALLTEQVWETDPERRAAMLDRAGELYAQALPSFNMLSERRTVAMREDVNLFFTPRGLAFGIPLVFNKRAFLR